MKNKRNLIQEIRRINNINLGKEVITEQETPILDLISLLVQRGSRDVKTQNLITQLGNASSQGKQISLLNQLRKSSDTLISNLVKSIDNDLTTALVEIIPRISRNKSVQDKIVSDIQAGVSMQETLNNISVFFKETYDSYVDDLLLRAFQNSLKKTYDEISASITPSKPQPPTPPKPQPPTPSPTNPASIIRNFFRDLLSQKPEFQVNLKTFQKSASDQVNRIKQLIEEYAQPNKTDEQIKEITSEVKKLILDLSQKDKEMVSLIETEIENGLKFSKGPERERWSSLKSAMELIKKDGADFGFIEKIASPLSEAWVTIREGLKYGLAWDRNLLLVAGKNIATWFPNLSNGIKALRKIQGVKASELPFVEGPFAGLKNFFVTSTFPGSLRGIPLGAPRQEIIKVGNIIKEKKTLESGYQAIYDLQKNSKTKAWASLAIEKITKVIKWQVYFGVLNALKSYVLFLYQSDEEMQKEYRGCIDEVGEAMARGDISLDESPDPEKIPSCLIQIQTGEQEVFTFPGSSWLYSLSNGFLGRDTYTKQELIEAILIRAYLYRGAEEDEAAEGVFNFIISPLIEPLTKMKMEEAGVGFFMGYLPAWAYELSTEIIPKTWARMVRGGTSEVGDALERMRTEAESAARELEQETGLELPIDTTIPTEEPVDLTTDDDVPPPPPGG